MQEKDCFMDKEMCYEMLCSGSFGRRAQKAGRRATFRDICHEAGVDSTLMDNLLYERLGMSGCDLLDALDMAGRDSKC